MISPNAAHYFSKTFNFGVVHSLLCWPTSTALKIRQISRMSLSSSSSTTLSVYPLQNLSTNGPTLNSYSITSAPSITKGVGPSMSFDELTSLLWEIGMATNLNNPFGPGRYWLSEWDPATSAYASTCSAIWDSSYLHFIQTEIVDGHLTWTPGPSTEGCFYEMNDPSTCKTRNYMVYPPHWEGFSYTPTTPCCGTCALTAGNVQVYHWPQATTTPSICELVDSNGFTLYASSILILLASY